MLEGLFGNKNVQKVLLFLFVNNTCYGTQMQRILRTPLTSLQNALSRLEKGKIITSYYVGKTKLFQLNPTFPLQTELEQLLKKAYTLLSPQDKKLYSLVQQDQAERRSLEPMLTSFWERLKSVSHFTRQAHSRSKEEKGWEGKGKGDVLVVRQSDSVLIFHERGSWKVEQGKDIEFSNIFRWTFDRRACLISLEHLRLGPDHPVFLFHLAPMRHNLLASVESHLCEEDSYLAQIPWDQDCIRLNWRVIGPRKNEELEYCYF